MENQINLRDLLKDLVECSQLFHYQIIDACDFIEEQLSLKEYENEKLRKNYDVLKDSLMKAYQKQFDKELNESTINPSTQISD